MAAAWLRVAGGLLAFGAVWLLAAVGLGGLDAERALDAIAIVTLVAVPAGVAAYAAVEYRQTGRLDSIRRQFDTRILVLMPVAIALNIVLGTAVASALRIPIYLDSIGTIVVAALGGPLAGAATGFLTNMTWTGLAPPPFGSPFAAPFALVAVVIGLLAGSFARWGWLRPRPATPPGRLAAGGAIAVGLIVVMAIMAAAGWSSIGEQLRPTSESDDALLAVLGWLALVLVAGTVAGLLVLLVRSRDLAAAYVVVAGVLIGVVAAVIAAPIAAGVFGGVTGSGADFLVAAFRQAGADVGAAVLGQALISDPIDKVVTTFVAYLVLAAMAPRVKARFPQGAHLIARTPATDPGPDGSTGEHERDDALGGGAR